VKEGTGVFMPRATEVVMPLEVQTLGGNPILSGARKEMLELLLGVHGRGKAEGQTEGDRGMGAMEGWMRILGLGDNMVGGKRKQTLHLPEEDEEESGMILR